MERKKTKKGLRHDTAEQEQEGKAKTNEHLRAWHQREGPTSRPASESARPGSPPARPPWHSSSPSPLGTPPWHSLSIFNPEIISEQTRLFVTRETLRSDGARFLRTGTTAFLQFRRRVFFSHAPLSLYMCQSVSLSALLSLSLSACQSLYILITHYFSF